jgi:hypothetical protein
VFSRAIAQLCCLCMFRAMPLCTPLPCPIPHASCPQSLKRPNNLPPGGIIVRTRGTKVQTLHPLPYQLLC